MRKHPISNSLMILAFAVVFTIGSCSQSRSTQPAEQQAQVVERANQVYKQYRSADYPTAKAALLDFAQHLDKLISAGPPENVVSYQGDVMVIYVMLAKLEEKNGGSEKEAFMKQAIARCQQLKVKRKCLEQELRDQVDRVDSVPLNQ